MSAACLPTYYVARHLRDRDQKSLLKESPTPEASIVSA
jgi:hypothetical protein